MSVMNGFASASRTCSGFFTAKLARGANRRRTLSFEALETISLLSQLPTPATALTVHAQSTTAAAVSPAATTSQQTVRVADALTAFSLPYTPAVQLFNPTLGTLTEVDVLSSVKVASLIKAQNTSTTTGTTITARVTGNYTVSGLSAPFSGTMSATDSKVVTAFPGGTPNFTGPSSAIFPNLGATDTKSFALTDAASLAFFTATSGHTTISPRLASNAIATATAPNGNLQSQSTSFSSGAITIVYKYTAAPTITRIVRSGIHNQPTQLSVYFSQPVNAADAANVKNYQVLTQGSDGRFGPPSGQIVTIASAIYDAPTHSVLLTTSRQLNFHLFDKLVVTLPQRSTPISVIFGGAKNLGGYNVG